MSCKIFEVFVPYTQDVTQKLQEIQKEISGFFGGAHTIKGMGQSQSEGMGQSQSERPVPGGRGTHFTWTFLYETKPL